MKAVAPLATNVRCKLALVGFVDAACFLGRTTLFAVLFVVVPVAVSAAETLKAFPGAEGFGAETPGGRGGRVIAVANLNDQGPGSFRAACEAKGPRIVVFRTGGTIVLKSGIEIKHPFITIAGQSACGGGICLRNDPGNRFTPITISTHDVVIRYLRVRPGASTEQTSYLSAMQVLRGGHNVVIDHCSLSWAVDEVFSTWYDPRDVTVQWCFIAEGLNDSVHPKGPHSKGCFIGDHSTRISLHHNLIAHNVERNPCIQGGMVDLVNNVVYNPVNVPSAFSDKYSKLQVNCVGNYFKRGPNTPADRYMFAIRRRTGKGVSIHVRDNISPQRPDSSADHLAVLRPYDRSVAVESRIAMPQVTTLSAQNAYRRILAEAGATLPVRDSVDRRLVQEVEDSKGKIIDDPSEVGGWPELDTGIPASDTDHDGMPDAWEKRYQLDPHDPEDRNIKAPSGYTWIEEYLNSLGK